MEKAQFAPVVGREGQRARRVKGKQLQGALRRSIVGTKWRCFGGILFTDHLGWFVEVVSAVWIPSRRTVARIHVKPMAIDPIFWDIVGLLENNKLPLSFRAIGAWTCSTPDFA